MDDDDDSDKKNVILEIFGHSLIDQDRARVDPTTLTTHGTIVGLYFSAEWCPPCRLFTNQLKTFYTNLPAKRPKVHFQVIFISSDEEEKDFSEYFSKMPWLAIDYKDRDRETQLSSRFNIVGLPTLVLLDGSTGAVITDRGRSFILEDFNAEKSPWIDYQ